MVLQENIIKLKDLLIKTKQTDEVKDIFTELEKYNIDINVLSTLIK